MISVEGGVDAVTADKLIEIAEKCPVHRTLEARSAVVTKVSDILAGVAQTISAAQRLADCSRPAEANHAYSAAAGCINNSERWV